MATARTFRTAAVVAAALAGLALLALYASENESNESPSTPASPLAVRDPPVKPRREVRAAPPAVAAPQPAAIPGPVPEDGPKGAERRAAITRFQAEATRSLASCVARIPGPIVMVPAQVGFGRGEDGSFAVSGVRAVQTPVAAESREAEVCLQSLVGRTVDFDAEALQATRETVMVPWPASRRVNANAPR